MNIEQLRERIKDLTIELEKSIFEKGLAAEENKDIRENFAYDYWAEKEISLVARITKLRKEITEKYPPKKKFIAKKILSNKDTVIKIKDLPKHKWL